MQKKLMYIAHSYDKIFWTNQMWLFCKDICFLAGFSGTVVGRTERVNYFEEYCYISGWRYQKILLLRPLTRQQLGYLTSLFIH